MALVRERGSSVAPVWRRRYEGAYEPAVVQLYGVLPEGRTGFLLRFQRGADDANGVLIALDERGVVSVVGEVEGQTVDLLPWDRNTIRVTTSPADPTVCYRWVGRALSPHPCPAR